MENFTLVGYRKVSTWEREFYNISANSKEEAIEKVKQDFINGAREYLVDKEFELETIEYIDKEDNDGYPTEELYYSGGDGYVEVWDNVNYDGSACDCDYTDISKGLFDNG